MKTNNKYLYHQKVMKELQIENVSSILNHFYFLIYEHYSVKDMTIGLRSYPIIRGEKWE